MKKEVFRHRYAKGDLSTENAEANYFARLVLMPEEQFTSIYHGIPEGFTLSKKIEILAVAFTVPESTVLDRIQELNLISSVKPDVKPKTNAQKDGPGNQ